MKVSYFTTEVAASRNSTAGVINGASKKLQLPFTDWEGTNAASPAKGQGRYRVFLMASLLNTESLAAGGWCAKIISTVATSEQNQSEERQEKLFHPTDIIFSPALVHPSIPVPLEFVFPIRAWPERAGVRAARTTSLSKPIGKPPSPRSSCLPVAEFHHAGPTSLPFGGIGG